MRSLHSAPVPCGVYLAHVPGDAVTALHSSLYAHCIWPVGSSHDAFLCMQTGDKKGGDTLQKDTAPDHRLGHLLKPQAYNVLLS